MAPQAAASSGSPTCYPTKWRPPIAAMIEQGMAVIKQTLERSEREQAA